MKKFLNEKYLSIFIIISIVIFPLVDLIGEFFGKQFFLQEEILSFIGILGVLFALLGFIIKLKNKKNGKNNEDKKIVLSDIFLITSILFCIISIIFSKSIVHSLTGIRGYSETPLQVLGYFTLFFVCTMISKEKNKKWILNTFLILAIFEAIVAFMQRFGVWPFLCPFEPEHHKNLHMAYGFTQNCNFFAAITVVFTALFSARFIYCNNKKKKYIWLFGAIICCLSTLFTTTNLGWLGIFAALFGIVFLELFNCFKLHKIKKLNADKAKEISIEIRTHVIKFTILLACFVTCFVVVNIPSGQLKQDVTRLEKDVNTIKQGTTEDKFNNFGSGRGQIWRIGIGALKKRPLLGVGFDIYNYSYMLNPVGTVVQNKGHCEYLHTAVTQGIFSGINYLLFAFYCCYFPFRKILEGKTDFGKSNLTKIFLVALFAYFAQALINSSITNVAIYKWILMGLVLPRVEQKDLSYIFEKIKKLAKSDVSLGKK